MYCNRPNLYNQKLGLTFEECEAHATSVNADGFAYRGTDRKYCITCTKSMLVNMKTSYDYAVYQKTGTYTCIIIVHESYFISFE